MAEKRSPRLLVVANDYTGHSDAWPMITLIDGATDEEFDALVEDIERDGTRTVWDRNEYATVADFRSTYDRWFGVPEGEEE
jgi:hypothetical protein